MTWGAVLLLFTLCLLEIFVTVKNMKALLTVEYNVHGTLNSLGGLSLLSSWHLAGLSGLYFFITKIMSASPPASDSLFPKCQVLALCTQAGKMHGWHFKRINANHQLLKSEVLGSIKTLLFFFPLKPIKPRRIRENLEPCIFCILFMSALMILKCNFHRFLLSKASFFLLWGMMSNHL